MNEIEQMLSKLEEIQFGGDTKYDSGEVLQYNISRLSFLPLITVILLVTMQIQSYYLTATMHTLVPYL